MSKNENGTLIIEIGGTKTSLRLLSSAGSILGNSSFPSEPPHLKNQIKNFLKTHPAQLQQLIAGIRGVWLENEKKFWQEDLKGLAPRVSVMSDVELAFYEKFGDGSGIILNAGTGSIAFGRSPDGKTARAGGIGPLLGDEGSAFWIGREFLKGGDWIKLREIAKGPNCVSKVAAFAKDVLAKAEKGDRTCRKILSDAQNELMNLILQVRRELRGKKVPLKLVGGMFENRFFRNQFAKKLNSSFNLLN